MFDEFYQGDALTTGPNSDREYFMRLTVFGSASLQDWPNGAGQSMACWSLSTPVVNVRARTGCASQACGSFRSVGSCWFPFKAILRRQVSLLCQMCTCLF